MNAVAQRWRALSAGLRRRLVAAVLFSGTGFVLGTALWLTPDPAGHGTHRQLGLDGCTILTSTGFPCPMCGATTTFTLWAHLQPIQGLLNQPFASLLFLMTVATFSISAVELVDPRGRWTRILDRLGPYEVPASVAFLGFMFASWVYKSWLMGLLPP